MRKVIKILSLTGIRTSLECRQSGRKRGGLLPSDTVVLVQYFVTVSSADGGRQFGKLVRWGDGCNNDGRSGKNDCFLKKREVPNYFVTVLVRDAQNV